MAKLNEFRGIRSLMYAKVTEGDDGTETWATPAALAGVQEISQEVDESTESKYYDNKAAIVVDSEGADTYTLTVSVPSLETRAILEGKTYDSTTKALIGTPRERSYYAIGFVGKLTDGTEEYVWVYKGKFSGGNATRHTDDDSTDSNNLEYTFTAVYTNKEYKNSPLKDITVQSGGTMTEETFFGTVYFPSES